jgi:NAD(P)-dependent dehydrogenase (short-subunit alcohol dehydrogenase family)
MLATASNEAGCASIPEGMKRNTQQDGKRDVVVITGATAGVGRATVREFARRGASIGLLARDPQRLETTRREVEELGGQAIGIPTDVADPSQVEAAAATVEEQLGPIAIWINNAMTSVFSPTILLSSEELRRVTEVTYLGSAYGTLAALRRMLPRNRGVIVQVGSALAYRSIPLQAAYCASKHAINGFLESVRTELLHDRSKVRVTQVHLPALNTPQFAWVKSRLPHKAQPVPPIYQPEVAARAIFYAAYHPRREFWVGGSTVLSIAGQKILPALLDRYLARTGYDSQQTAEPEDPNRPDNLWQPVPGPFAAHGSFDQRAYGTSWQLWLSMHPGATLAGLAGVAGAMAAALSPVRLRRQRWHGVKNLLKAA